MSALQMFRIFRQILQLEELCQQVSHWNSAVNDELRCNGIGTLSLLSL